MRSYISRCTLFVISLFCLISGSTFANVIDDDQRSGGFFALIPYNTDLGTFNPADYPYNWNDFDDDVTYTLWPEGQWINGNSSNQPIYSAARTYVTSGGDGYLDADQTGELDIYIGKSVMRVGSNDPTIAAGGSQKIRIFSSGGSQIANDHYGAALEVSGSNNSIELWYGSYDSEEVNNDTTSNGNKNTVELQGITNAYFKNVSFHGGDIIKSWITGTGGTGLSLGLTGNGIAVIDNVIGKNANEITGGKANGGGGGTAFRLSGGSTFATNLYATAGEGDDGNISFTRDSGNANVTMNGGNAIQTTSANLSIHNGELTAKDGAVLIVQNAYDNYDWQVTLNASGGNGIIGGTGNGTVENLIIRAGDGGRMSMDDASTGRHTLTINGGDAYSGNFSGGTVDGNFYAGDGGKGLSFTAGSATIFINGGNAFNGTGSGRVVSGIYEAGHGGSADLITTTDDANTLLADGGVAYNGAGTIDDGIFRSGNGGIIKVVGINSTTASANGGHGASATGLDITGGTFYGGSGGLIEIAKGTAEANGGHGLRLTSGDSSISGGSFYGGSGGTAYNRDGTSSALAGVGLYIEANANADINGGIFHSGADGVSTSNDVAYSGYAIRAEGAGRITMNGDAQVHGNMLVSGKTSLQLYSGSTRGDIQIIDTTASLEVSPDFSYTGQFQQFGGNLTTTLTDENQGAFFKNVYLESGTNEFQQSRFISAQNASIQLRGQSLLQFGQGATLSSGSTLDIGSGQISSGADVILSNGSSIRVATDGTSAGTGKINITGSLDLSQPGTSLHVTGKATQPSGAIDFLTLSTPLTGADKVHADLGWLTTAQFNTNTYQIEYDNISLDSLVPNISTQLAAIVATSNQLFATLNQMSHQSGSELIRFTETQTADSADVSMQTQHQVANLIASRSSEVRAKTGFASSTQRDRSPIGVAGPSTQKSTLQGWIRGYQSSASRDAADQFTGYSVDTTGSVIGLDKRFGSLLIGISGGSSSSRIDGNTAYRASQNLIQGSIYASIGNQSSYLDLAFTQADIDNDISNSTFSNVEENYRADLSSFYIGAGKKIELSPYLALQPAISLLLSSYEQDGYNRIGIIDTKQLNPYSTDSQLMSLGVNISSNKQIDWFNRGLAMVPEFRLHWLREFSPDMDDISYTSAIGSDTLSVRSREENLLKFGVGLNVWNWHFYAAKFQVDFDRIQGSEYTENLFSGKVSLSF